MQFASSSVSMFFASNFKSRKEKKEEEGVKLNADLNLPYLALRSRDLYKSRKEMKSWLQIRFALVTKTAIEPTRGAINCDC